MRTTAIYTAWLIAGLALGVVLTAYMSDGMVKSILQKLPGCF